MCSFVSSFEGIYCLDGKCQESNTHKICIKPDTLFKLCIFYGILIWLAFEWLKQKSFIYTSKNWLLTYIWTVNALNAFKTVTYTRCNETNEEEPSQYNCDVRRRKKGLENEYGTYRSRKEGEKEREHNKPFSLYCFIWLLFVFVLVIPSTENASVQAEYVYCLGFVKYITEIYSTQTR